MRMIQKDCNCKIDKTDKKVMEIQKNLGNGNSNTDFRRLIFVNFPSTIDQVILINLKLQ